MSLTTDYKSHFDAELFLSTYYKEEELGEFTAFLLQCFHEAFSCGYNMSLTTDYKSHFDAELFLSTYYKEEELGEFTAFLLQCFHEAFSCGKIKGKQLLDVGTGPTIHSVISASPHVEEIYLSDYTPSNLDILRSWWKGERKYLKSVFEYLLTLENKGQTMEDRNNDIRSKVKAIVPIDIRDEDPFGTESIVPMTYDVVTSSLTIEGAALTMDDYKKYLKNLMNLVKVGGYLVLLGSTGTWYKVGSYTFPKPYMTIDEVRQLIKDDSFKILKEKDVITSGYKLPKNFHTRTDSTNFFIFVAEKMERAK